MASRTSTPVKIPATTAHRQFGELIKRAFSGKEHFIVEKDGLPVVAILSMTEYEALMHEREQYEADRQRRLKQFQHAARAIGEEIEQLGLTEEEALAQLEQSRREAYIEHYGDERTP